MSLSKAIRGEKRPRRDFWQVTTRYNHIMVPHQDGPRARHTFGAVRRVMMLFALALFSLLGQAGPLPSGAAARHARPLIAVFVDDRTEQRLGRFPYDRSILAAAVRRAVELHARGVVLKFFLDRPASLDGDNSLAEAMATTKVILQAGDGTYIRSATAPTLPRRSFLQIMPDMHVLAASEGGIPIPGFLASSYAVGFVDYRDIDFMPMIEQYRGKCVKSLFTLSLELISNQDARVLPGTSIAIGDHFLVLDRRSQASIHLPKVDNLSYISLVDFINPRQPIGDMNGSIVIIGFDASRLNPIQTSIGPIRPHRLFCYALLSLYEDLFMRDLASSTKRFPRIDKLKAHFPMQREAASAPGSIGKE